MPYHHGDLARALVDEAIAVVEKAGIEGLTLSAVAKRAGVSHAAVYRHFEDKSALLLAVAGRGFVQLARVLEDAVASAPKPSRAAFLHVGRSVVRFAVKEPVVYRVMFNGVKGPTLDELAAGQRAFAACRRPKSFAAATP